MPTLKAAPALIQETRVFKQAVLRLRYSSPLFRLPSAQAVSEQVSYPSHLSGFLEMFSCACLVS